MLLAEPINLHATSFETLVPEPIQRLARDARSAAGDLSLDEVRYIVDQYYEIQKFRIGAGNQRRSLAQREEPIALVSWVAHSLEEIEKECARWLDAFGRREPLGVGAWLRSVCGIGPVITAGLLAHIDIDLADHASSLWRLAGLDPSQTWERGQVRPYNATLKTLVAFKAGESFVKVQNNDKDVYGKVFVAAKARYARINADKGYVGRAAQQLAAKRWRNGTEAKAWLEKGMLPPAHIHAMARRYAAKLFLSHLHHVWFELKNGRMPPDPWILNKEGHSTLIAPPNHACVGPAA